MLTRCKSAEPAIDDHEASKQNPAHKRSPWLAASSGVMSCRRVAWRPVWRGHCFKYLQFLLHYDPALTVGGGHFSDTIAHGCHSTVGDCEHLRLYGPSPLSKLMRLLREGTKPVEGGKVNAIRQCKSIGQRVVKGTSRCPPPANAVCTVIGIIAVVRTPFVDAILALTDVKDRAIVASVSMMRAADLFYVHLPH